MPTDRGADADMPHRTDRAGLWWCEGTTARRLAAVFVLYGLVATVFLGINVPPYQNPDEGAHFMRAAQLADGGMFGTLFQGFKPDGSTQLWAGASGDIAILRAAGPFLAMGGHPEVRATRAMWEPRVHWSHTRTMLGFPNTIINPPLFYVPSAIGVLVGHASRMTVPQTMVTSRLLTGVAAVAVGAVAIACAGGAAVWLFAVLTLPGSLDLIASCSQDALMLACSALAGALLVRLLRTPEVGGRWALAGLTALLAMVAAARVPYVMLALVPLAVTGARWRSRVIGASVIAAVVVAWWAIVAAPVMTNAGAFVGADPAAQLAWLLAHPLRVVPIGWQTVAQGWRQYLETFVGYLGWGDTPLPPDYIHAAWAMLGIAALAAMFGLRGQPISAGTRLVIAAGLLLAAGGVFFAEYVIWTPPGSAIVQEVEGRYFRPLALVGAALLPALGGTRWARLHNALVVAVALFPVVSLAVVMQVVVTRYYLQ